MYQLCPRIANEDLELGTPSKVNKTPPGLEASAHPHPKCCQHCWQEKSSIYNARVTYKGNH